MRERKRKRSGMEKGNANRQKGRTWVRIGKRLINKEEDEG